MNHTKKVKTNPEEYLHVDVTTYITKSKEVSTQVRCTLMKGYNIQGGLDQDRKFKNLREARDWANQYSTALRWMIPNAVVGQIEIIKSLNK